MRQPNPVPPPDAIVPAVRGRGDMDSSPTSVTKRRFDAFLEYHINDQPRSLESELLRAVRDGDLSRFQGMIQSMRSHDRAQLTNITVGHFGLLHIASHFSNVEICKYLVEEIKFDINACGCDGVTPLSCAALFGQESVAEYLLNNGSDPNKTDEIGCAPLHNAAQNGDKEVVRLLLAGGATVDTSIAHGTPLHVAASYGNAEALKILLDHHSNPNQVSEVSGTPLVTALYSTKFGLSESKSLECVKLLVKAGADVNSAYPNTALVVATSFGLTDCIAYLLEAGANANIPDNQGLIPIEIAANMGRISHVKLMLPHTKPIRAVAQWTIEGIIGHVKSRCSLQLHKRSASSRSTVESSRVRRVNPGAEDTFSNFSEENLYTPQQKKNRISIKNRYTSPRQRSHSVISSRTSRSAQSRDEKSGFVAGKTKRCRKMLEYGFSSESSESSGNSGASSPARGIVSLEDYVSKNKGRLTRSIPIPFQNQTRVLTRSGPKVIFRRSFICVAKRHARKKVMNGCFGCINFFVDLLDFSVNLQDVVELLYTDSGRRKDWLQYVYMIRKEVFGGQDVPDDIQFWLQKIVDEKDPWEPSLLATHIYMVDARQAYGMFMVFSSTIHGLRKNKTTKYLAVRYCEALKQYDDWERDFRFSLLSDTSTRVNPDTGAGYEPDVTGLIWCIRCCWQHLAHKYPHLMVAVLLGEEIRDLLPELQKVLFDLGLLEFTSRYMA